MSARRSRSASASVGDRMGARDLVTTLAAGVVLLAASLPLGRVLVGDAWRTDAWSAVGVALAIGAVGHLLRWRVLATTAVSSLAWLALTVVSYLDVGVLPSPSRLAELAQLVSEGVDAVVREPAPAPSLPGLLVLVWSGCWWVTHAVHTLLLRARRTGPALLAATVLWAFPLAIPHPPGSRWLGAAPFLAAALLLLLLDPDPDLRGWRRQRRRGWIPAATGAVLGTVAVLVGLLGPGLVPGYGEEAWLDVRPADQTRGYQPIVDVTRRLKQPTPIDLLHVETDRQVYLRLAGLETFDGGVWRLGPDGNRSFTPSDVVPADRRLPLETEIGPSEDVTVRVENLGLENIFVPAPYHPLRVRGPGAERMIFSRDGSFLATSETTEGEPALLPGIDYTVEATVPSPSADQLALFTAETYAHPFYDRWTQVPHEYPELRAVTARVASQADAQGPAEIAFALQEHFRSDRFTYSLDVPALRSSDELVHFVTSGHTGYCEQFATAMAVMLRLEGIPARVAVGFRLGEEVGPDRYVVTTEDAHAWVEVLFPGAGWVAFEPTPALGDTLVPSAEDVAPQVPLAEQAEEAAQDPQPQDDPAQEQPSEQEEPEAPAPQAQDDPAAARPAEEGSSGVLPVALFTVLLLLGAGVLFARSSADEEEPDEAERIARAERRLYATARSHGVGRRRQETVHEVARRWSHEARVDEDQARTFAEIAQAASFGGGVVVDDTASEAERLAAALAADLRSSVPTHERLIAPLRGGALRVVDLSEELAEEAREALTRVREEGGERAGRTRQAAVELVGRGRRAGGELLGQARERIRSRN